VRLGRGHGGYREELTGDAPVERPKLKHGRFGAQASCVRKRLQTRGLHTCHLKEKTGGLAMWEGRRRWKSRNRSTLGQEKVGEALMPMGPLVRSFSAAIVQELCAASMPKTHEVSRRYR
jgi:hypothetical protein